MNPIMRALACCLLLLMATGCANKPIRHLASDAALIKPGTSTKEDVLTYLGDPDSQQQLSATTERWIYYEERPSTMQKAPFIGTFFDAAGYSQIQVTFEGDRVVDCRFSAHESDEYDWSDDYSWQEQRQ